MVCGVWCVVWCGVVCVCAVWRGCWFHGFMVWGFTCGCWFGRVRDRPSEDRPSPDRPSRDRPSPGPPFPWTAQNFALFFSLSRRKVRSFLPSLGVFSWNFGGFCEDRDPQMYTFGLSGCRVKPRRLRDRLGFTRQPENSKRAHFRTLALQTPPKFHGRTSKRGKKRMKIVAGEKNSEILGPPTLRAPASPLSPPPDPPTQFCQIRSGQIRSKKLAKCGQTRLAKCGRGRGEGPSGRQGFTK